MNIVTLLEMVAGADPDRIALGDAETGLSNAALLDLAARAAARIAAAGPRKAVYATVASPAFPVALFGAARVGQPFVPVSYRLAAGPLRELILDQAPALLVAEPAVLDGAADDTVEGVDAERFLNVSRQAEPLSAPAPDDPDLPAVLLHTSGTTGKPKVAVLRHRHLTSYVLNTVDFLSAAPDEAQLVSVPPYHIAGVAGLLTALYSGRRMVQLPNFDAATWVRLAREQRVTHAMVVPTMLARVVEVLEREGKGLPHLRHLSYGGGRMPLPVIERALRLLPHVDFVNGYGLTETTSSIAVLGPEEHRTALTADDPGVRARLGSVGRPLPAVEITVRDAEGQPVATGERGELWVRGPQVSGEYAHASVTDAEGWFRTRDAGWTDEEGYVYVDGRLDDVIVRGGENLSPGEIEAALVAHPAVAEAAVVGLPDEQWGEVVAAVVVLRQPGAVGDRELKEWIGARLRSSRVPALIAFRDTLPRNEMGKLLRRQVRSDFAVS